MSASAERSPGSANGRPRHSVGAGDSDVALIAACAAASSAVAAAASRCDATCLRELEGGVRIVAGNAGDHPLVLKLLVETRHAPLGEDFQSRLDEPSYRPNDRLLVRRDRSIVAHVHVGSHIGWFDGQRIPLVKLQDFAALPEFSHAGYADALFGAAESIAAGEGAIIAVTHSEAPELFTRRGWSLIRGQGHTRAGARAVLAHLDAQDAARRKKRKTPLEIRTWRHFEMDAIREVYNQTAAPLWGALVRSEAAWQWLIGRKAQDQILLAVDAKAASPDDSASDLLKAGGRVVGYAVVRGSCIVEMMTLPDFPAAATQLLARACHDAMDRDHHSISLYTPAADPLHELLVTAGGAWISDATVGTPRWAARLLAPEKWVERFFPAWHERARSAGLERPYELGIAIGDERWQLTLTRRSSRLERVDELPSRWIECDRPMMESLLLGNVLVGAAIAHGACDHQA